MKKKQHIYLNDWLGIHPYSKVQPSDYYFVKLADRLYDEVENDVPEDVRKDLGLYAAAYLEDLVSGLGLWNAFVEGHRRLYGRELPFYALGTDYESGYVNEEDLRFLIWNTCQKEMKHGLYLSPLSEEVFSLAGRFCRILDEAYEEAPENPLLENYFSGFDGEEEARTKLAWLFGDTYLTRPSMLPYIRQITPSDRMIMPTGPLALFLHEWIDLLAGADNTVWKQCEGLYWQEPEIPETVRMKNEEMYRNFVEGTDGRHIVYLDGYDRLKGFLTEVLGWPDDEDHTLPQMKRNRNFVLMAEKEKGILLAKDVCEYIADPLNPLYNKIEAERHAFRLLSEETLCPPDLLSYCIRNGYLPDAGYPGTGDKVLVAGNADFIARYFLLYYYRGD